MRFGIFSISDHYPQELERTAQQLYHELLEQIVAADELGFDSFWLAEHHFHEYGIVPRPPIMMAAAAQRTHRIRLGSAIAVLPFDNPLRAAEDYAMVDILSNGRLNMGVGSGYLQHEFLGFAIDGAEKRERFDEALEIMCTAWQGERFSYAGKYHTLTDVAINVVPMQKPHPPISVAVLRNEAAAFVGGKGHHMMMIPYATTENISELAATTRTFRESFARAGSAATEPRIQFGLHAHCAASTEQARSEVKEAMDRYVRTRLYAKQRSIESLIEKNLVAFGDPGEIITVAKQYEQAGLTDFLLITNFGGLPHKKVLASMELIAKHVLPVFAQPVSL